MEAEEWIKQALGLIRMSRIAKSTVTETEGVQDGTWANFVRGNKAFRHVENSFIQRFFIYSSYLIIHLFK